MGRCHDPNDIHKFAFDRLPETADEFWQRKERRIRTRYLEGKANFIMMIERLYEDNYPDVACGEIHERLRGHIRGLSRRWASSASKSGLRLYPEDFESKYLWAIAELVCGKYHSTSEFWLYEHIFLRLRSISLDTIKWAKRDKRVHDYTAASLEAMEENGYGVSDPKTSHVEDDVANREFVSQLLNGPELTEQERRVITYIYEGNFDASLQNLATILGIRHRQQAKRVLSSIKRKLQHHIA